jgi:outer membrane protein assembly factor BamB
LGAGTDLNAYALSLTGEPRWKAPTGILSNGYTRTQHLDGSVTYRDHHYQVFDAATGDLNGDGAADVVFGLNSDYHLYVDQATGQVNVDLLAQRNRVRALDGRTGEILWEFEGQHHVAGEPAWMADPVMADVNGDGQLDVLVRSSDRHLYALDGPSGHALWVWSAQGLMGRGLVVADLDADGMGEIALVVNRHVLALE